MSFIRKFLLCAVIIFAVCCPFAVYAEELQDSYTVHVDAVGDVTIPGLLNQDLVKSLGENACGRASDVIALAKTQEGYQGLVLPVGGGRRIRCSYFGNVWNEEVAEENNLADGYDEKGSWCSEFVYWCLVKGKVLTGEENLTELADFAWYFNDPENGDVYRFYASSENSGQANAMMSDAWFAKNGLVSRGTLKLADLLPGDILQVKYRKSEDGPHHTVLFLNRLGKNQVQVIEGNVDNTGSATRVRISDDVSSYQAREVVAVIRPHYTAEG